MCPAGNLEPSRRLSFRSCSPFVAICLVPATALAYIDPGTGSFVLQGILAAVVGAGVAIKIFWRRIAALLGKQEPDEDDDLDE